MIENETTVEANEPEAPKKRGRPKRADVVKQQRRRRKGSGREADMKLTVADSQKDPNFEYRWIRNDPGRLRRLTIEDDYDVVHDEAVAQEGDQRGIGIIPERHGGMNKNGQSYNMLLVRKPRQFYDEDQKEKQSEIDEVERQLNRGESTDPNGLAGPSAYVPDGGISVKRGG